MTASGPGQLGQLEWPMIPRPGWPRRVLVNRQPWRLDRRGPGRLVARPD